MAAEAAQVESEVAEPQEQVVVKPRADKKKKTKRQPPYNVILWNDDDHTYYYVVEMLQKLFGHPVEKGYLLAKEVDTRGKAVVFTTAKEHAEFKRDQVLAYGKDREIKDCAGSITATIKPAK